MATQEISVDYSELEEATDEIRALLATLKNVPQPILQLVDSVLCGEGEEVCVFGGSTTSSAGNHVIRFRIGRHVEALITALRAFERGDLSLWLTPYLAKR